MPLGKSNCAELLAPSLVPAVPPARVLKVNDYAWSCPIPAPSDARLKTSETVRNKKCMASEQTVSESRHIGKRDQQGLFLVVQIGRFR